MTQPENDRRPDESANFDSSEKKKSEKLDGILNELKSVLSDLGQESSAALEAAESLQQEEQPLSSEPTSLLDTKLGQEGPSGNPTPSDTPPDTDFWSGNVLGWPHFENKENTVIPDSAPAPIPPAPLSPVEPQEESVSSDLDFLNESPSREEPAAPLNAASDLSFLNESPVVEDQPEEAIRNVRPPELPVPQEEKPFMPMFNSSPEAPPAFPNEEVSPEVPPEALEASPSSSDLFSSELNDLTFIPPPPVSPLANESETHSPISEIPFMSNPVPPVEQPPLPPEAPAAPDVPEAAPAGPVLADLMPGSVDRKSQEPKEKERGSGWEMEMKPSNLIQISCIYPEGEEKAGQQFVMKLRAAADKAKSPLNIQAVYINPWGADKVDVASWGKSSLLAGSDLMFILVSKKNQDGFKSLSIESAAAGIDSRLVVLEHIGLRALYADLLVDLKRKRNGKD